MTHHIQTDTIGQSELGIDPDAGAMDIERINMNSGITLIITRGEIKKPIKMEYLPPFESVGFGFYLSGYSIIKPKGSWKSMINQSGESVMNWAPRISGLSETIDSGKISKVGIFMNHELLSEIADRHKRKLPSLLQRIPDGFAHAKSLVTLPMKAATLRILTCPYRGLTRNLFIEGKALELLAYKLDQIGSDGALPDAVQIRRSDMERIHCAADLLKNDPENAPNLEKLAHSVGMCRTKFHECFRKVYGITPFDYLQEYRLETARLNLLEGRMNVTEAAFAVGYSSPSYFSSAFKKHFGDPPGKYCKKSPLR